MESSAREIDIPDVRYNIFEQLLLYLYTDEVTITTETAMELFQVPGSQTWHVYILVIRFYCGTTTHFFILYRNSLYRPQIDLELSG
jgi:hypothetical protein